MQFISRNLSGGCIIQRPDYGLSCALPGSYRRKGKINPSECRVPKNSKERKESLFKWTMQRIEENNRMVKIRDLLEKMRDTKGMFHAKKSTKKDRNGMDLTEAEDIKNRWQEYTEELYKKDLNDIENHDGVITYLELDILECEVKQASESVTTNKATGGDGTPDELFQILKIMLSNCCCLYARKFKNSAVATGLENVSFHSNPKEG